MNRKKLDVYTKVIENYERCSDSSSYMDWIAMPNEPEVLNDFNYADEDVYEDRRLMQQRKLGPIVKQLSLVQQEVINRRFDGEREIDIALALGIGQPGVSMAYKRAMSRMKVLFELPTIDFKEWERVVTPFVERTVKDRSIARKARVEHRVRVLYTLYCTSSYKKTCATEQVNRGVLRTYANQLCDELAQGGTPVSDRYLRYWTLLLDNLGVRSNHGKN